ncbi:MAG: DMT family transporter [Chloroflexi bacterium]|nr:DMT family transporter [Chloroflexota bacterium]
MYPMLAPVLFGLAASLCWGSGDFSGGLASRRASPSSVIIIAYTVGFFLLVGLALIWHEPFPSSRDLLWGALAGVAGGLGLLSFYSALSRGQMGIAAPVSAMLTATIPVLFSTFTAGLPNLIQVAGFILALLAIGLISGSRQANRPSKGIGLALLAGCGFGCFFVLISRVSPGATFWPLATARLTSILLLFVVAVIRTSRLPSMRVEPLMILAGILDALGNTFFVLAAHSGRLDVAAMLSSLYPAATVILAALILRERVTRIQGWGIAIALVAVPMIVV